MVSRWLLGLLGLFHLGNGLYMVLAPGAWYAAIPGVADTGPMNPHFITDIGLAFAASGAGLLMAVRQTLVAATLALAGSVWPLLHALFHIWSWFADHMPPTGQLWLSEGLGVVAIGLLGAALAWANFQKGEV
jgi:hypothetical protein